MFLQDLYLDRLQMYDLEVQEFLFSYRDTLQFSSPNFIFTGSLLDIADLSTTQW